MARRKNSASLLQAVGPEMDELKLLFGAYGIPLETSYAALIDVADCGRRATGLSPDFQTALDTGLLLDRDRQLSVKSDLAKGILVGEGGVSVVHGTAVMAGDAGVGIVANVDEGIAITDYGIGVVANVNKGISVDAGGLRIAEGFRSVPVGAIVIWPSRTVPNGWLLCEGGTFDDAQYPQLFSVLNGHTLPDFRGRYPRGTDTSNSVMSYLTGQTGMPDGFSLSVADNGEHTHQYNSVGDKPCYEACPQFWYADIHETQSNTSQISDHTHTVHVTSSHTSAKSRPMSIGSCFIIAHD